MARNDRDQIVIDLRALPDDSKSFALARADNGYVLWYYDPRNRIMSPGIAVFRDPAQLVATLVSSMLGNHADDPKIKQTLERALEWAELGKLEFHVTALKRGGYTTMDPELTRTGVPGERLPVDYERAATLRTQARELRAKLEKASD